MRSESTVDYNIGAVMRRRNDGAGAAMRPGASGDSAVVGNVTICIATRHTAHIAGSTRTPIILRGFGTIL